MTLLGSIRHHYSATKDFLEREKYLEALKYQKVVLKDRWTELLEPAVFLGVAVAWPFVYYTWKREVEGTDEYGGRDES